jgi:hypothetical protein
MPDMTKQMVLLSLVMLPASSRKHYETACRCMLFSFRPRSLSLRSWAPARALALCKPILY